MLRLHDFSFCSFFLSYVKASVCVCKSFEKSGYTCKNIFIYGRLHLQQNKTKQTNKENSNITLFSGGIPHLTSTSHTL